MRFSRARLGAVTAVAVGVFAAAAGTAAAAPSNAKNAGMVSVSCNNGKTYMAVTNGGGNSPNQSFSPAHDLNSTAVLVPTAFEGATVSITDSSGSVDSFMTPPATKGSSQGAGSNPLQCTYTFTVTFTTTMDVTLPDGTVLSPGTYTQTVDGSVTGFIPSQQ